MKKLLAIPLALLLPAAAHAAALSVTPGGGATLYGVLNGSDFLTGHIICDATTPTQCWAIDSSGQAAIKAADGAIVTIGANNDAAATAGGTGTISAKLREATALLNSILTDVGSAATSALQTTANTKLDTINTTLGTPMQATGGTVTVAVPTTIPFHALSAASNNCTNVKNAAGTLWEIHITNTNTSGVYDFRLYNKATAPVPSTDSALVTDNIAIPVASAAGVYGGIVVSFPAGRSFSSGIGFCLTGAIADNDNTSATTGAQINGTYQ